MSADVMRESQFSRTITTLARKCGWLVYHVARTKYRKAGFPDLVMLRDGQQIVAELKKHDGVLSEEQKDWLLEFGKCKSVQTYVWRPEDWPTIQQLLQ